MDQITQGAPLPVPPPSPQPAPQQIPPTVAPQTQVPSALTPMQPASVQPTSTQSVDVTPTSSAKLKNPKLWIGAGIGLLVIIVVSAFFLGKPPLFGGKAGLPKGIAGLPKGIDIIGGRGAADVCASLDEAQCARAAERGKCEWIADSQKCQAVRAAVESPVKPPPEVISPIIIPEEPKPEEPPLPAEPLPADLLEQLQKDKLESAQILVNEASQAVDEAQSKARKFPNVKEVEQAAKEAKKAYEDALTAINGLKNAKSEDEIHNFANQVQAARDSAVAARDRAVAAAEAVAAQLAAAGESDRRAFEQRCGQEKANYDSDVRLCTLADDTNVSNIAELEEAVRRIQEESAGRAFKEFCKELKNSEWKDNQCIFNGTAYNNRQALEAASATPVADEDQKKKDCEDKNKDLKAPEWRWDGKECVGGKVAIADVQKCPPEKPVLFGNECHKQDELCSTLGAKLTDELKAKNVDPKDIEHGVTEINMLSNCGFTAAQFLAPFEEEKAKNECAVKDQSVWEWNAVGKICKNKQEARMRELEALIASLQQQLVGTNNGAQINALNQQIANLSNQINALGLESDQPIVVNIVTPPPAAAPAPAPAPAPSGGGGAAPAPAPAPAAAPEIVAVSIDDVKKEDKKEAKKKKEKKTTTETSAETAAVAAAAVSTTDVGAGATTAATAASAGTAAASAASAAAAKKINGTFIQGRTGPGILIYPLAMIGTNGLYYFFRKRRKK